MYLRLDPMAPRLFSVQQNEFIKGRNITGGIMILHLIIHHTHVKKHVGVVLKLDFAKTYDKVNWGFLLDCFRKRGFSDSLEKEVSRIKSIGVSSWALFPK